MEGPVGYGKGLDFVWILFGFCFQQQMGSQWKSLSGKVTCFHLYVIRITLALLRIDGRETTYLLIHCSQKSGG